MPSDQLRRFNVAPADDLGLGDHLLDALVGGLRSTVALAASS